MARQPRFEICCNPCGQRSHAHPLPSGGPAYPLEALGHSLQPIEVRAKVLGNFLGVRLLVAQPLDPRSRAHQRCAELVRGLTSHRYPETISMRVGRSTISPDAGEYGDDQHCELQDCQHRQLAPGSRRAEIDLARICIHEREVGRRKVTCQLHDTWIVQVLFDTGIARIGFERHVGAEHDCARTVHQHQRHAGLSYLGRDFQQLVHLDLGCRIGQRSHDAAKDARLISSL